MKDIYSPLEIDEEWDNYAPMADGGSTALMERPAVSAPTTNIPVSSSDVQTPPAAVLGAEEFKMPASNVMRGNGFDNTGTQEPSKPDAAYTAAEALIDKPATNTDTFDIADTSSSSTPDTSGLVKITPGETTPEIPSTDTTHKIEPVKIDVMGGETLSDPIDESTGGNKIVSVPEATPLIVPMVEEEDSDDVINTGTISPDVIKASDDSGETSGNNSENSESSSDDDTDDTESDTAASSSETKADKPKVENKDTAPASGDTTIEAVKNDLLKRVDALNEERGKIQASIEAMEKDKKKYTDDYNEDMAAIGDGIKAANEKLADYDKFIAQLESLK